MVIEKNLSIENSQVKIASFNLFNYLEPPNAYYDFDRIYSAQQWHKKQKWLCDYLTEFQPDIIGFQEVFSCDSLKELVNAQGYDYFKVVEQPHVIDDFIYSKPVVAIASKYPIIEASAVELDSTFVTAMGLAENFSFSRKVLRATIDIPHLGLSDCYVVHFKSKRSMIEHNESSKFSIESQYLAQLKSQISGGWASSIQRGSEAALLLMSMLVRRDKTGFPMLLMGDFNACLSDGVLNHLVVDASSSRQKGNEAWLEKFTLQDAWQLYLTLNQTENSLERTATHYYGGKGSTLDYILLSCEFNANYQGSVYSVSSYQVYDRHLINPIFDRDGESTDHGIVLITLELRR